MYACKYIDLYSIDSYVHRLIQAAADGKPVEVESTSGANDVC